jgi:phospholipid/cholesterol/gamma-HCH transport system substrate-binding protein
LPVRARKAVIGLVVAGTVLAVGSWCVGSAVASEDSIEVTALFDSGAGLYLGNDVSILGMPVGSVTRIEPQGTQVAVTMSIDGGTDIPADATAVTVSTSVLTDRHVEFTPPYTGGPTLADGDVIGLDHTRTPIEFDRLIAMADNMAVELQGDGQGSGPVADLLGVSAAMTVGNGPAMSSALTRLSEALRLGDDQGEATANAVTDIVDNLASLSSASAANEQTISEFGSTIGRLTDVLAASELGAGDTGAKLNEVIAQATDLLQKNREGLRSTATDATTVTTSLVDYQRQIAEFLDLAPLLMDNAYNAIDRQNRTARVHAQLEKVFFDGQLVKEVCNLLGMRQLGCSTGTLADFGPDFGISGMLEGIAGLPR